MKQLTEEHKKKISEKIKQRWKEGKQRIPKFCTCGSWISLTGHNCKLIKEKQRQAQLKNPTRYWVGKQRDKETMRKLMEGYEKYKPNIPKGPENPNWSGGHSEWWHEQARKIMGEKIGRPLLPTEIVHHIDGNYKNNNITNLIITNRREHIKIHHNEILEAR